MVLANWIVDAVIRKCCNVHHQTRKSEHCHVQYVSARASGTYCWLSHSCPGVCASAESVRPCWSVPNAHVVLFSFHKTMEKFSQCPYSKFDIHKNE